MLVPSESAVLILLAGPSMKTTDSHNHLNSRQHSLHLSIGLISRLHTLSSISTQHGPQTGKTINLKTTGVGTRIDGVILEKLYPKIFGGLDFWLVLVVNSGTALVPATR